MHQLRSDEAFVKEPDFVMEQNGHIIGQNMFVRVVIQGDDSRDIQVLAMRPICVDPKMQREGYGTIILNAERGSRPLSFM